MRKTLKKIFSQDVCTQFSVAKYKMFPAANGQRFFMNFTLSKLAFYCRKYQNFFYSRNRSRISNWHVDYRTRARIDLFLQVSRVTESQMFSSRFGLLLIRSVDMCRWGGIKRAKHNKFAVSIWPAALFVSILAVPCTDSSKRNLEHVTLIRKNFLNYSRTSSLGIVDGRKVLFFAVRGGQHAQHIERGAWRTSV